MSLFNFGDAIQAEVGVIGQVWAALDENMMEPIQDALKRAEVTAETKMQLRPWNEGGEQVRGYSARDVLYWWLYSEAWRSRRRVWYCVIQASATARNADWW
jgi:hypothetical protein